MIIDKESKSGLVFKNNNLEHMSLDEICNKSFDKLHNHLKNFYSNMKDDENVCLDKECLEYQRKNMRIKYNRYKDDTNIKKEANKSLIEVFEKVKDETLNNFNEINNAYLSQQSNDDKIEEGGY